MPVAPRGSSFVTAVGWIVSVGAGLATAFSALQNIVFHTMMASRMPGPDELAAAGMPAAFRWLFGHLGLLLGALFVVCLITFVAAVGLLRRRNWARLVFIGLLGLGIAWNLAGIGLQHYVVGMMEGNMSRTPADLQDEFKQMLRIVQALTAVFAIGFSVFLAWMIKRLVAQDVRAEFRG